MGGFSWILLLLFFLMVQECCGSYRMLPDVPNKQTETDNDHG